MDDLKRNGSGYYDFTAYEAIKNAEKENGKMKCGDIWEVEVSNNYKCAVVIAVQDKFCNVLMLNDEKRSEEDVQVKVVGLKYTNPAMPSYMFNDRFSQFIRRMEDHEFEDLLSCIAEKLAFKNDCRACTMEALQAQELEKELREAERKADELQKENEYLKQQPVTSCDPTEIIVLKTQCDMYKQQYEQLLERMIAR